MVHLNLEQPPQQQHQQHTVSIFVEHNKIFCFRILLKNSYLFNNDMTRQFRKRIKALLRLISGLSILFFQLDLESNHVKENYIKN